MNAIKETVITDFNGAGFIDNFRLGADGTLEKREGYARLRDFGAPIRGAVAEEYVTYLVSGSTLYALSEESLTTLGQLSACVFESDSDEVTMFIDAGIIYILGGGAYYTYALPTGTLSHTIGYVPTIRRNASSTSSGQEFENFNALTSRVKMSFNKNEIDDTIELFGCVKSVVEITTAGRVVGNTYYSVTIDEFGTAVIEFVAFPSYSDSTIIVEYELDESTFTPQKEKYLNGSKAYVLNDDGRKRLFLYGYDDGTVYTSEYSYDSSSSQIRLDYFPYDAKFTVGDGRHAVESITALGSRTVMMTSNGIFELTKSASVSTSGLSTHTFSYKTVTNEIGICKNSGIILYEDELYFLNENGLYKFAYNAETFDYYAIRIDFAEHASPSRSEYDGIGLFLLRKNSEMWCLYDGGAYVYSLKFKRWYHFTGFSAVGHMLLHCNDAAFFEGNSFYAFKDNTYTDAGVGFDAVYESKHFLVDSLFKEKTVYGFGAAFDRIEGAKLICTLINDKGREFTVEFTADNIGDPSLMVASTHARLGRTSYVKCRFVSPADSAAANIRSIMLRYREIGGAK